MSQSSELTTRDVLQQVDRRLELIEGDVRNLHQEMNARFDAQDAKFGARLDGQDAKFGARLDGQDAKFGARLDGQDAKFGARLDGQDAKFTNRIDALDAKFDMRFRWIVGLILMSWMSTMGAILFRLGPLP